MIKIRKSETADTRTCNFAAVSKDQLYASSLQHISDVCQVLDYFAVQIDAVKDHHDPDKLSDIDGFHADFVTGFKQTNWWDRHRRLNRHHLTHADGIPADVNLIDVLDFIADCVMAGMGRSGSVYPLHLPPELLEGAFQNTVDLLKRQVVVVDALLTEIHARKAPMSAVAETELTAARLAVNDWHACASNDELDRWRRAQRRLIDAAKAVGAREALAALKGVGR